MKRLFAMETEEESKPNDMLIDKLLKSKKLEKEGMSVTVELIKQRQDLKEDISKAMGDATKTDDEVSTTDKGEGSKPAEGSTENKDEPKAEDSSGEDKPKDGGSKPATTDKEKKPEDDDGGEELSQSKEGLEASIGGALKGKEEGKAAKESHRATKMTLDNLFSGLSSRQRNYVDSLRVFGLESEAVSAVKQPVVYVKEEVVKAVDALVGISQQSVAKNAQRLELARASAQKVGERLGVYSVYTEKERTNFTNEVVTAVDLLSVLCAKGRTDPSDNAKTLDEYMHDTATLVTKLATADVNTLSDVFSSSNFEGDARELTYRKELPGFYNVSVGLALFSNYIDVKYSDFQVYRIKTLKTFELQESGSISITKDADLAKLLKQSDALIVSLGLSIDALTDINATYLKLIDKLKSLSYDVQNNSEKDLSTIGLDALMTDFVRFRLMTDLCTLSMDMASEFLSGLLSLLGSIVTLKESGVTA